VGEYRQVAARLPNVSLQPTCGAPDFRVAAAVEQRRTRLNSGVSPPSYSLTRACPANQN
jgi:hypothetical protein